MAGFVIHLAVAKEYARKNKNEINNYNDFYNGVVAPDLQCDKSKSHYAKKTSKVNLSSYLSENDIITDFDKGYFLHLLTDYLFYNKYLDFFSNDIYNDYDITNKYLINKYDVYIPDNIKDKIYFLSGNTKIVDINLACKVIDEVSNLNLNKVKEEVINNKTNWNVYKKLKHIDNRE